MNFCLKALRIWNEDAYIFNHRIEYIEDKHVVSSGNWGFDDTVEEHRAKIEREFGPGAIMNLSSYKLRE